MGAVLPIIGVIGTIASIGGTIMSASSAAQQAQATKQASEYQAQVAQVNAQIAKQNAAISAASGEQQAASESMKAREQVGAIKAAQAAGNVDVTTGSAVDVRSSAAELGQLNTLTTLSNQAQKTYGFQSQATGYEAQSGLYSMQASQAAASEPYAVAGSLLTGASSTAKGITDMYKSGLLGSPSASDTSLSTNPGGNLSFF